MNTVLFKSTKERINGGLFTVLAAMTLLVSCKKNIHEEMGSRNHASAYSSEVLGKWMTMQLRLIKNATGITNHGFSRPIAYTGIAALESMSPGLNGTDKKWGRQWNGLTAIPVASNGYHYYYPANVNGAMATINRLFFPNANQADKAAIDSLEQALTQEFLLTQPAAQVNTSAQFGKDVANVVFNWAETDGYRNASAPYTVPVGAGLWKPTPPTLSAPLTPYWGNNRTIMLNGTANTMPAAPPAYSSDPSSAFYQMVKQVYDASQTLTDDQKAIAIFWRDVPGASSPGHWLSILQQVVKTRGTQLDKAAIAYALMGTAINDALIACFKAKYTYNLVRPVTYIQEVMGYISWNTYIGTPAHPEYPSAHASLSSAAAEVMAKLFGNQLSFTDHTYDYMGLAPRNYPSFTAIAQEAGISRFYPGIHHMPAIEAGLLQGKKVCANIFRQPY